jgi:hypothetical protein
MRDQDKDVLAIESELSDALKISVRLLPAEKGIHVRINCPSQADLDRVYRLLMAPHEADGKEPLHLPSRSKPRLVWPPKDPKE